MQKAVSSSNNRTFQFSLTSSSQLGIQQLQHCFTATVDQQWLSSTPSNTCFFVIQTSTEHLQQSQPESRTRYLLNDSGVDLPVATISRKCIAYKRKLGCTPTTNRSTMPGLLFKTINHQENNQ